MYHFHPVLLYYIMFRALIIDDHLYRHLVSGMYHPLIPLPKKIGFGNSFRLLLASDIHLSTPLWRISMSSYLFTSESVSEGHPDKVADQISDAILDAILEQDKLARVACETLVTTGMALIAGEITTSAWVDMPEVVRQTIREIGYNSITMGFDWQSCAVMTSIDKQSPDIAQGVDEGAGLDLDQRAGDQ